MKTITISQLAKSFANNTVASSEVFSIEAGTINRIYQAHQAALNRELCLEAKVAALELAIVELELAGPRKSLVVYG